MTGNNENTSDWLHAFLPLGAVRENGWEPRGAGVLIMDQPLVWLVTSRELTAMAGDDVGAWVSRQDGGGLLNLSKSQREAGVSWIHHPAGISAALMPLDPTFRIKAFSESQCTRVRDLQPLQPAVSIGCLHGPDAPSGEPTAAVMDGIVSAVDATTGAILTTAPQLARNTGAPLLLASPYGGSVTLAGLLLGETLVRDTDPRSLPVRFGRALCVDAVFELVRCPEAHQLRQRVLSPRQQPRSQSEDPSA